MLRRTLREALEANRNFRLERMEVGGEARARLVTATGLLDEAGRLAHLAGRRVVVSLGDDGEMVRRQIVLALAGADVCLVQPARLAELGPRLREEAGFGLLLADAGAEVPGLASVAPGDGGAGMGGRDAGEGRLFIYTSGTTGAPKLRQYTYGELLGQANVSRRLAGLGWGGFYPATQFAGLQVLMAALAHDAPLVLLGRRRPDDVAACLRSGAVGCATGTPTLWRQVAALLERDGVGQAGAAVRQVTLGGEASTQPTLDQLARLLPQARLTHIYASTELGPVFSVSDGRAGFPRPWLGHAALPPRFELEVREEELRARRRDQGADAPWQGTGDLVRVEEDRVYFLGRSASAINVGGAKALPERIEAVIESVPGVVLVRVFAQPNPVTGNMVAAEIQAAAGVDPQALRTAILAACRERLAAHELPRKLLMKDVGIVNDKRSRQS
ncbi:MAG TPA: AMP-binding protein [Polyangia bacterium]|jgi:acyl-CoA synthetase (AMP-forming)/AMP-acid ligase II|nr:AMP-binding protein [Polyangia bacterium]